MKDTKTKKTPNTKVRELKPKESQPQSPSEKKDFDLPLLSTEELMDLMNTSQEIDNVIVPKEKFQSILHYLRVRNQNQFFKVKTLSTDDCLVALNGFDSLASQNLKLPGALAYRIAVVSKKLRSVARDFEEQKQALVEKFGLTNSPAPEHQDIEDKNSVEFRNKKIAYEKDVKDYKERTNACQAELKEVLKVPRSLHGIPEIKTEELLSYEIQHQIFENIMDFLID